MKAEGPEAGREKLELQSCTGCMSFLQENADPGYSDVMWRVPVQASNQTLEVCAHVEARYARRQLRNFMRRFRCLQILQDHVETLKAGFWRREKGLCKLSGQQTLKVEI